jgi:hypothetical protein
MTAKLMRVEQGSEGSFGVLVLDGQAFCVTLELPWRANQNGISCIPTGQYSCQRSPSPLIEKITGGKWKETFEITGVPGRSRILFHSGNTIADSRGCVLLASSFGKLKGERAVLNSGATFDLFMTVMRNTKAFGLKVEG